MILKKASARQQGSGLAALTSPLENRDNTLEAMQAFNSVGNPRAVRGDVWAIHPERVQAARESLLDDQVYAGLAEAFSALADPNRTKIICALMRGEFCVCDLAAVLGISASSVSQHLRILRTLRWVRNRKQGRLVYYSLDDQHIQELLQLSLTHAAGK